MRRLRLSRVEGVQTPSRSKPSDRPYARSQPPAPADTSASCPTGVPCAHHKAGALIVCHAEHSSKACLPLHLPLLGRFFVAVGTPERPRFTEPTVPSNGQRELGDAFQDEPAAGRRFGRPRSPRCSNWANADQGAIQPALAPALWNHTLALAVARSQAQSCPSHLRLRAEQQESAGRKRGVVALTSTLSCRSFSWLPPAGSATWDWLAGWQTGWQTGWLANWLAGARTPPRTHACAGRSVCA